MGRFLIFLVPYTPFTRNKNINISKLVYSKDSKLHIILEELINSGLCPIEHCIISPTLCK